MSENTTITPADSASGEALNNAESGPKAATRRFPPVIQVLTDTGRDTERQLAEFANQCFRRGSTVKEICAELRDHCQALGYDATIGAQELYSTSMPSMRGQTVISALLMIDLRPLWTATVEDFPRMRLAG